MDAPIETVMSFTNCTREEAVGALAIYGGDMIKAMDLLFKKPVVTGEKHIPPPPKVETGQTEEQKALCAQGRDLMDKLTVVFSGAHRKILEQSPPEAEAGVPAEPVPPTETVTLPSAPQPDSPAQTLPPYPQSETPP
jgi:hypothetical protein